MYERFTPRTRLVMQRANLAAQQLLQEYIAPEHVLLGMLHVPDCLAHRVLIRLGVDPFELRLELQRRLAARPGQPRKGSLPQTQSAKRVIVRAMEEVRALRHDYVGTEHLLLGLLDAEAGLAAELLGNRKVTPDDVRREIADLHGRGLLTRDRLAICPSPGAPPRVPHGYDRFTDKARKVLDLARREAARVGSPRIDSQHLLVGLLDEGSGVAAVVMRNLGVEVRQLRATVGRHIAESAPVDSSEPTLAQRASRVLDQARLAAEGLGHDYVGTEHLLLALLEEADDVAGQALRQVGLDSARTREQVLRLLGETDDPEPSTSKTMVQVAAAAIGPRDDVATLASPPAILASPWLTLASCLPTPVVRRLQSRRQSLAKRRLQRVLNQVLACDDRAALERLIGAPCYALPRGGGFQGVDFAGRPLSPDRVEVYEHSECILHLWFVAGRLASVTGSVQPGVWDLMLAARERRR